MTNAAASMIETVLRDELSRATRALDAVVPVLGHFLASSGSSLVSDAIVARVRGMLNDLARQLFAATDGGESGSRADFENDASGIDSLSDHFALDIHVLSHLHATAVEAQLTERFSQKSGVDPVLGTLFQELVASDNEETAEIAMAALASQSRFIQSQRRMQYPVTELPPEILERVLRIWARITPVEQDDSVTAVLREVRSEYDEAATRIGRLSRLIAAMRGGAIAALDLHHSGVALFTSALAALSEQKREDAVLSCHESQAIRLALGLRAAGLDERAIGQQLALFQSTERLLHGIGEFPVGRARAMLHRPDATPTPKAIQ